MSFYLSNLTRFYAPKLTHVGWVINLNNIPAITLITLPVLTFAGHHLHVGNNPELLFVDLSSLQVVLSEYLVGHNARKMSSCEFPELSFVDGYVSFFHTGLTRFYAPRLTLITSYIELEYSPSMTSIIMPMLTMSVYKVQIYENPNLEHVDLSSLQLVLSDRLYFNANQKLPRLELPALTHVELLFLLHNSLALTRVYLPELVSIGSFDFQRNVAVTSLSMPKLVRSRGYFYISPYDTVSSELTAVTLPVLTRVDGELVFNHLLKLATVDVAQLAHIGGRIYLLNTLVSVFALTSLTFVGGNVEIYSNAMLTTLSIPVLATVTGNLYICGNTMLTLPIYLEASVRMTAQCAFTVSGSCPALDACPVMP
jgi:hypothetical protein